MIDRLRFALVAVTLLAVMGLGCGDDSTATCIAGSTQACLCVGGASGVQSCVAGGTFAPCECVGVDGGLPPDRDSGPLPDSGTPFDAGPSACAPPLAMCGASCVDTSTDEA